MNPMRDMGEFDRLFDETMELPAWRWSQPAGQLAIDVAEEEGAYIVKALFRVSRWMTWM